MDLIALRDVVHNSIIADQLVWIINDALQKFNTQLFSKVVLLLFLVVHSKQSVQFEKLLVLRRVVAKLMTWSWSWTLCKLAESAHVQTWDQRFDCVRVLVQSNVRLLLVNKVSKLRVYELPHDVFVRKGKLC